MRISKRIGIVAVVFCAFLGVSAVDIAASENNNIYFQFWVKSFWGNGRVTEGRYRSTTDTNDAWKVQLKSSGEGEGTITNFWLENYDEENVTRDISAVAGEDAKYDKVKSGATERNLYLTGENNNYNGNSYSVWGYWDEETGIILN